LALGFAEQVADFEQHEVDVDHRHRPPHIFRRELANALGPGFVALPPIAEIEDIRRAGRSLWTPRHRHQQRCLADREIVLVGRRSA
jgi:hypothetical protein